MAVDYLLQHRANKDAQDLKVSFVVVVVVVSLVLFRGGGERMTFTESDGTPTLATFHELFTIVSNGFKRGDCRTFPTFHLFYKLYKTMSNLWITS